MSLGNQYPNTLQAMDQLANVWFAEGNAAEAEPLLREVWQARLKLGTAPWMAAASAGALGEALTKLNRFPEAETLLLGSYADLENDVRAIPAHDRVVVKQTCERLVALYTSTNEPAKRDQWANLASGFTP